MSKNNSIKPAKNVVVCKPADNKTKAGLTLATGDDKKNEKPELGVVIAIGKGEKPLDFKVGDTVVFERYSTNHIEVNGKMYTFVYFKHIMAKV